MAQCDSSGKNVSKSDAKPGGIQMSFKDWKMQKEGQNNSHGLQKRLQDKYKECLSNGNVKNKIRPSPSLLNLNTEQKFFCSNVPPSFGRPPPPCSNNSGMTNNIGCEGNIDFRSKGFESCMNFSGNCFGYGIRFNDNGFKGSHFNTGQSPSGGRYRNTGNINSNLNDSFFQMDGLYHQKDMLQEPIPFRYNRRAIELRSSTNASDRNPRITVKPPTKRNEKLTKDALNQEPAPKREPKIFARDPNRKDIKKPFIPMPKHPESEPNLTTEERKQQWKEYREAMKPFKNKDFYNAKRVVQRLGKKDPKELDEKQKFRLINAQEKMAEYKQKFAEKYDSYVKSADKSPNDLGELFVLRKGNTQSHWGSADKPKLNQYTNYGNFGESYGTKANSDFRFSAGRKILGGTPNCRSYVTGGTLDSTLAKY